MDLAVSVASRIRQFVRFGAYCLLALMLASASAQPQPGKLPKVGFLELGYGGEAHIPFAEQLKALGYTEGKNIVYERRYADNHPERLPALAQELVQAKVDVLVAFTNVPAFAARQVTKTVPIVVQGAHGGVETGLFASLARPGGNLTGTESLAPELDAKRVEILKQIVPGLTQLTAMFSPDDPGSPFHLKSTRDGARQLGIGVTPLEVKRPQDLDAALVTLTAKPPGGLLVFTDVVTDSMLGAMLARATRDHVPTMCEFAYQVELGCMVSYGPLMSELVEGSARQVDKILKGAKPGELPVEQITRYELVLNQWVAHALGITIPPAVLLRADRVVEIRLARIGVLSLTPPVAGSPIVRRLAELGWITGKNLAWEVRYAAGNADVLPELAASLVRSQVDVILAVTNSAAFEARRATRTIPIVVLAGQDLLQTGLIGDLVRPGGNLTGTDVLAPDLDAKRVELLRELFPRLRRIAVLYNPADAAAPLRLKAIGAAAMALGITVTHHEVRRPDDYDGAIAAVGKALPEVLWTLFDPLTVFQWKRVADFALSRQLPTFCEGKPLAQAGCLVSHAVSRDEVNAFSALQIDHILRGANPGDLPIERPSRFELVANLKVARSLGVTIPTQVLKRADEVIE
jgi:putative tryptophan/tyrosine transport system substrate-binding protein